MKLHTKINLSLLHFKTNSGSLRNIAKFINVGKDLDETCNMEDMAKMHHNFQNLLLHASSFSKEPDPIIPFMVTDPIIPFMGTDPIIPFMGTDPIIPLLVNDPTIL